MKKYIKQQYRHNIIYFWWKIIYIIISANKPGVGGGFAKTVSGIYRTIYYRNEGTMNWKVVYVNAKRNQREAPAYSLTEYYTRRKGDVRKSSVVFW